MAGGALDLFSLGIHVSGNNIANAQTPGYVRSDLIIKSSPTYKYGNLILGTGAYAAGIEYGVDQNLLNRIQGANGDSQLSNSLSGVYNQLQDLLDALGDNNISTNLNDFVNSLQAVVNQPEDPSLRALAVQQGQSFADIIRQLRSRLDQLEQSQTSQISTTVDQANQLINSIQKLNTQIASATNNGLSQSDDGTLLSQRNQALDQLSQLISIRTVQQPNGTIDVYSGSDYLILGGSSQNLQTVLSTQNGVTALHVQTTVTNTPLDGSGGQLSGLIEGRDTIIHGFSDQLDQFTAAVISQFNQISASGQGITGFTSVTGTNAVNDTSAALNAAGLSFPPQNGSFNLNILNTGTGLTQTTNIPVDLDGIGTDTSLASLQSALNAVGNVTATITSDGKLQLTADAGYQITFGNDTSGVLAGLGINTFFTGNDSTSIQVNDVLKNDANFLATGQGGGPSDNRNVVELAAAFDQAVSSLNGLSINQYWNQVNSNLAQSTAAQQALADGQQGFLTTLTNQRDQQSGVNLDEEMIKILQYQHSYQAAARIVTTIEQLMDTLIQM